ncbi:GPO family capsid scaffolding protein [Erwinia persicina]|uniref:GPO family capsid scaffolding protein n=1 Tax=Erwinia persicina TaxID=55211 RepID=UPI0016547C8D|nr:GPO family capsid scaffolding protein [Erwinia persicina]MBC3946675.1 GPO family capsid scaffolding protein [Erwinia persicina]
MSHLRTDWLCVATEGDSVDGRVLKRQWLIDAAETYDINLYGALIWPEHKREYGNFGEVLCAMWQDDNAGLAKLYVQLRPNANLIEANSRGQLIYFSAEFSESDNWRGTGRSYLEGLAVTDSPASVGTTRLKFSKQRTMTHGYYACRITRGGNIKQEAEMNKKHWQSWFGIAPKKFAEEETETQDAGGEDKLQVLAEVVNDLETRITALETQLSGTQDDMEVVKEVIDTQEFSDLRNALPEIVKNFTKLDKKVTELPRRQFGNQKKKETGFKFF